MDDSIARRTQECITKSGLTQSDVASTIGLTPSQLSKSLGGTRQFSAVELAELATLLNVSMYWLVTGETDPMEYALAARHEFNPEEKRYLADGFEDDKQILDDIALVYRQAYC